MPNITKSYVDGLKCRDAAYVKWDSKLTGFGVRVYPRDPRGKCKKSLVLRYANAAGKRRMMVLGQFGAMTVTEAREKASRASNAIRDGNDPLEEKKTRRRAVLSEVATFGQVVDKYIELRARTRQRMWKQSQRVLEVNC
ncbi:MAG: Arm DNA-binding domain-containing protein, partial [Alphaproteobacteria bacterium]|nr:Arm DNA-binding domain-containing protein [Alphaproteobacteria bacterium]